MARPRAVFLPLPPDWPAGSVLSLARALAASEPWSRLADARLAVGSGTHPPLAVLGRLDDHELGSLEALATQLDGVLADREIIDWPDVQELVARLADRLTAVRSPEALAQARWLPVPRGGHVVLGLLAYALDTALPDRAPPAAPLTVVVDDVSISGSRVHRFLRGLDGDGDVLFAHLASAPELRTTLGARFGVEAVAARDLHDRAHDRLGAGHAEWEAAWRARDTDAVWIGQPEHVVLPWKEPDISVWNDRAGRVEAGWRTVPHADPLPVDILETPRGTRLAAGVVAVELDDGVVLARPDREDVLFLDAEAADVWHALVTHAATEDAVDALLGRFDAPRDVLAADATEVGRELEAAGFLGPAS